MIYNPFTTIYNSDYNDIQWFTMAITMNYNDIESITIHLQWRLQWFTLNYNPFTIYNNSITITPMGIYNMYGRQLQYHCNKILGSVHNGLSTKAEGLLTKVRATTHFAGVKAFLEAGDGTIDRFICETA